LGWSVAAAEDALLSDAPPAPAVEQAIEAWRREDGAMPERPPDAAYDGETDLAPEAAPQLPSREDLESARDDLREQFPELRSSTPTLDYIRQLGGLQARRWDAEAGEMVPTDLFGELNARGINRNTVARLFNNKRGVADIDNIVASEFADGGTPRLPTDDTGAYLDRNALIEAIAQEAAEKRPAYRTAEAEDAARQLAELDDEIEAIRSGIERELADAPPVANVDGPYFDPPKAGDDPLARADAIEREIEAYVSGMDGGPGQEVRWRAAEYLEQDGGYLEDAIVRAMMDEIEKDFSSMMIAARSGAGQDALPDVQRMLDQAA
jgi:hypothetical protein